jgi:carboxyl-terminal processing protease
MGEPLVFDLKRAAIPSNNVRASFMVDEVTGYIALRDFGETATKEIVEAAERLQTEGMQRMILDLRGNPGGLLPQAIQVSSLFIPGKKIVVSTKGRLKNASQEYYSSKNSPIDQLPLIVLINRGSASASEIVAGAVQDHDRGLIIGTSSWGKGLVQSVFPLDNGTKGLALTTSRYYTPSGRNIQGDYHSIEAYLNPSSAEDLYFEPALEKTTFKTRHGREVQQARGITPDVYIKLPDDPERVQKLEARHAAFFNFAARHQDEFGEITMDWEVTPEVMSAFYAYLTEEGISSDGLKAHAPLLQRKIKRQFLTIQGLDKALRYTVSEDPQVLAALELFGQAKELLRVYNGEQPIREDYGTELKQYAQLKRDALKAANEN